MSTRTDRVTAFAPATVANVAVGFDILGFALSGVGDRVTLAEDPDSTSVTIGAIRGVVTDLPRDPQLNTATVALLALLEEQRLDLGLRVEIDKGIPLGSGMGGSAASAVAAVVAANRLLDDTVDSRDLLRYALAGEAAATGAAHADNAAASLSGGMIAVVDGEAPHVVTLPVPREVLVCLVHPHLQVETRAARGVLRREIELDRHVRQSMNLCGFLVGCYAEDHELIRTSMVDLIAEPSRAPLIPGYENARSAALEAGALGFAISGSGPSVFAWVVGEPRARDVAECVGRAFRARGVDSDVWIGPIEPRGAHVIDADER